MLALLPPAHCILSYSQFFHSYLQMDFSYDRTYLMKHLMECQASLGAIVKRHLTEKSLQRVQHVFGVFNDARFLDAVFQRDSEHHDLLGLIVKDMSKAMDAGDL